MKGGMKGCMKGCMKGGDEANGRSLSSRRRALSAAVVGAGGALLLARPDRFIGSAHAADGDEAASKWPGKTVRLVVPLNAGGVTDALARQIGERLQQRIGQNVIIENKVGASGIIGSQEVAKAAPDGNTLLFALSTSMLINQFLYRKLPYSPTKDFALIQRIADAPVVLSVNPKLPVKNAKELIEYIKANRGKLSYGSWGIGSYAHLCFAYLSRKYDADMTHAPYKGEAPMIQDVVGGELPMALASAPTSKPFIDNGRLRAIGVTGDTRMSVLPDVPTMKEQGVDDECFGVSGFVGMAAPAKTPEALVQRIAREVKAVCDEPAIRQRIVDAGFIPMADTPEAFRASYQRDMPVWEKLVKESGASLD